MLSPRRLRLAVLGLSLSSSWGNGHATTYRALLKAFAARGHAVTFLERDQPWYGGAHRDLAQPDFCDLVFYEDLPALERRGAILAAADAVLIGSYVPEGRTVGAVARRLTRGPVAFYDIDTPVTLARLDDEGATNYLAAADIPAYAVYFSFTGGPTLEKLERHYGSPAARALYCSVDADLYRPIVADLNRSIEAEYRWDIGYLGTYSPDRQPMLDRLLLEPARRAPHRRFVVAGPQYPADIRWPANVERIDHVAPADHPEFYGRSRFTLNVTRTDMVRAGYSPSVRLFEAAACATPIISDRWAGLDRLLAPDREILLADSSDTVLTWLDREDDDWRRSIGTGGRSRILAEHTAAHRAATLEAELLAALERHTASVAA